MPRFQAVYESDASHTLIVEIYADDQDEAEEIARESDPTDFEIVTEEIDVVGYDMVEVRPA